MISIHETQDISTDIGQYSGNENGIFSNEYDFDLKSQDASALMV